MKKEMKGNVPKEVRKRFGRIHNPRKERNHSDNDATENNQ